MMSDWLGPLLKMFYAPARGMAEVRDRAPLGPALLISFLTQSLFHLYVVWPYLAGGATQASPRVFTSVAFKVVGTLLFSLIVFVPALVFVTNLLERRASFGLTLQQEFAPAASTVLYARAASTVPAFLLAVLLRVTGGEAAQIEQTLRLGPSFGLPPVTALQLAEGYAGVLALPFFTAGLVLAAMEVFRFSLGRAVAAVFAGGFLSFLLLEVFWWVFGRMFASPFLLLLLFFLMRGYIAEVLRGQRARASFRQNLEASTLNPADASAHYNLGLLHLQRRELQEARARFESAIEIDPEEADAHYQLGRIARAEGRWADAIRHYGETLTRDQTHSQHEVWREAGATYISAGQYEDAREALERFLEHRQSDPEGLYLMGRAHAGLGRRREAVEWLQACIEAVRTAPAYKYRSEKRWANEAQQFLRSLA